MRERASAPATAQETTLGAIAQKDGYGLVDGPFGSALPASDYTITGIPVIRGSNLSLGVERFRAGTYVFVSEVTANRLKRSICQPGDIIFTKKGTIGQTGIIPHTESHRTFLLSSNQMKLSVDPKLADPLFVFYYVSSPQSREKIVREAGITGVPKTNLEYLRNFPIVLPSLDSQRRIASVLSAYDDLIENNTRRIKILEEMAQRIYREWFVNFRFPGHEKVRMVDSPLGLIPEGWEVTKLSTLVETQYGYTESASKTEVGPHYVRGMDINKRSYIQWDTVPYCPINQADYSKYRLSPGDVLVIRMADPGKVGIVEKDVSAVFASYLIRLHIVSAAISPYFLFYFLLSDRYQDYVTGASTGATRKSASAKVITDIDLVIPTEEIRQRFEGQVSGIRRMLNILSDKNANLRRTRDLLLPKLISGEVDVEGIGLEVEEEAV